MDAETRAAIAALSETMNAGFARMDAGFGALDTRIGALDTRIVLVEASMDAGFARAERYFELQQAQHLELRADLTGLGARVDALSERVRRLEHEVSQLRDFVTREIAEIRLELRDLRRGADLTDELRHEIAELTVRVDRLEQRQPD